MGYVENTVLIERPRPAVFDAATTARYWPQWHPATRGVEGAIDHPVQLGEVITEHVNIAGREGLAHWTCVEYMRPERLVLEMPPAQAAPQRASPIPSPSGPAAPSSRGPCATTFWASPKAARRLRRWTK